MRPSRRYSLYADARLSGFPFETLVPARLEIFRGRLGAESVPKILRNEAPSHVVAPLLSQSGDTYIVIFCPSSVRHLILWLSSKRGGLLVGWVKKGREVEAREMMDASSIYRHLKCCFGLCTRQRHNQHG